MRSSVLSSQGHTLLIGFFGDFFGNGLLHPSLMDPRARDASWAKHRLLGWIALSLCLCALACVFHGLSLCRKKWKWRVTSLQRKPDESNASCLGEHCDLDTDDTTQREPERPFHSLSCRKPSKHIPPDRKDHPFHPCFLGGTSVPAFLHRLVC